jgi:hypothetical protein
MGEARQAEVITWDTNGNSYSLELELDGWDNEPMMSPGIIIPGSWGNIPPGETFCCPSSSGIRGAVCINGSVPGHVITPCEEVVLFFEQGRMTRWQASDSPASQFFASERAKAQAKHDDSWDKFAELGVGLNPAITVLSGNPLSDEKAIRTIHIAIGDNTGFGHNIKSDIHHDLVIRDPTLRLDGLEVISRGVLRTDDIARARIVRPVPDSLPADTRIRVNEARATIVDGHLKRLLQAGYRKGNVTMTEPKVSSLLSELWSELRTYGWVVVGSFLQHHPRFGEVPTEDLLNILHHYRTLLTSSRTP